jgi:hypothetical protein
MWLGVIGVWYVSRNVWREWRDQRAFNKEMDQSQRKFKEQHVRKPRMVSRADCGAITNRIARAAQLQCRR